MKQPAARLNICLNILFLFCSHFLRSNGSDFLTNLARIVLDHGRTLPRHGSDQIVFTARLKQLSCGVIAPTVNVVVESTDFRPDVSNRL